MNASSLNVFTDEQVTMMLADRDAAIRRDLENAQTITTLNNQLESILAGFKHYTKKQVAELFCCSEKQIDRYERDGYVKASRIGRLVIYPATQLIEMAERFNRGDISQSIRDSNFPKSKRNSKKQDAS